MLISFVVTGYIFYLYLKLQAERGAATEPIQTPYQQLVAAVAAIDKRIDRLERIAAGGDPGGKA